LREERSHLASLFQTDDPFAKIGVLFADYLLKKGFLLLVYKTRGAQTLQIFREIADLSSSGGNTNGQWWALVGSALSHWHLGQLKEGQACFLQAEALYSGLQMHESQRILSLSCQAFSHLLDSADEPALALATKGVCSSALPQFHAAVLSCFSLFLFFSSNFPHPQ